MRKSSGIRPHSVMRRIISTARSSFPVFAICLLTLGAVPAFGQEVTGGIKGQVNDVQGAAVAGATVELITAQRTFTTTTDGNGRYEFLRVASGVHQVKVAAAGFGSKISENVAVELGKTLSVNFELTPGMAGESVTVTTSDEPIVDISSNKVATNVNREEFALIPKTLNFSSIINVAPGVRQEDKSAGFTIDGASGSENVFIIDGVEVTRVEDGALGSTKNVPFDFVREVQIKSAGYEAEYGGATGGVINVQTRGGGNDWHGEARLEFQTDELIAHANPVLRLDPLDSDVAEYFDQPNLDRDYRIFAPVFSVGGPIVKDKLWFFGSYAPQLERTEQILELTQNTGTAINVLDSRPIQRLNKTHFYFGRLDFAPTDRLQANVSFIGSPSRVEGQLVGTNNQTSSLTVFQDIRHQLKGGYTPSWNLASGVNYSVTDNFIIGFRAGRTYLNDKGGSYDVPVGTPLYNVVIPCNPADFDCAPGTTSAGLPVITNNFAALFNITTRTNVNVDATYSVRLGGQQHIFKGGYQYNRLSNKVDEGQIGGLINLYFDRTFAGERGEFGYYRVTDFGTKGDVTSNTKALFVQDQWTIHPRVTLNLGIRFEHEFLPTFPIDATFHPTLDPDQLSTAPARPIEFGWGDKIAPRIGVAWDVMGDQKLKIFGSFGVFYDTMKYELPRGSFGGDRFLRTWYKLETLDFRSLTLSNTPGDIIDGPLDFRVPSSLAPEPGEQPGIDPNLEPTRQHEFTVGGDYALRDDLAFGVRFTRKVLDRTIEDVGRHDADGNEIYTIGNPGYGSTQDSAFFNPAAPRAVREYTGLEFRLDKRFSNNWYANVTYLWSKLYGNYAGLASSDEVTNGVGRSSPNVNRYYDFPTLLFDAAGQETLGRLPTDRPHTFKGYAAYRFNYGSMSTEVGGSQLFYSGTPVTTRVETLFAEHIAFGREDGGRSEAFSQTDLLVTHRWNITERIAFKASMNVQNLFDERNELVRYERLTADGVELGLDESDFPQSAYDDYFGLGYDGVRARLVQQGIDDDENVFDPRYNFTQIFQAPRQVRFGFGIEW